MDNNVVSICGVVPFTPTPSHRAYNEDFYTLDMLVSRLSGKMDAIRVTVPERLYPSCNISPGDNLRVTGQYRSRNAEQDGRMRLLLSVFATGVELLLPRTPVYENHIELCGYICHPVTYRKTPLGREISDLLLAVNRRMGRSDYIPCVAWGRTAVYCAQLRVGERLRVCGRIQSREYRKLTPDGETTRTACEVSVQSVVPAP